MVTMRRSPTISPLARAPSSLRISSAGMNCCNWGAAGARGPGGALNATGAGGGAANGCAAAGAGMGATALPSARPHWSQKRASSGSRARQRGQARAKCAPQKRQ
jgi:hypothetical protein